MGRIEEALAKLQARQQAAGRGAAQQQPPLGRVVARADAGAEGPLLEPRQHAYGGKHVEIDFRKLHAHKLLAPDSREQRLAEEYRVIKRPLLRTASRATEPVTPRGNLWVVTSAVAGEGKTFTCVNLCLSIAREKDWSVVLVDADSSKRHLTQLFGVQSEPGLMDLLRSPEATFDSMVMPTNVPGLALLPAGTPDEHAAELLASARMSALCEEVSEGDPQRIVVFDSAPLLLTADAPVLALQAGQVVLVVQANKTPRDAVLEAQTRLDPSKAISLILNQADESDAGPSYGAYGSYGTYGNDE